MQTESTARSPSHTSHRASHATLFPFLFFFGTSVIVRAVISNLVSPPHTRLSALYSPPHMFFSCNDHVPGGKLCFNLSAFSESFNTNVYRKRWHRTLNLIWWALRFMCPAMVIPESACPPFLVADIWNSYGRNLHLASLRRQISMNCLMSDTSRGMVREV